MTGELKADERKYCNTHCPALLTQIWGSYAADAASRAFRSIYTSIGLALHVLHHGQNQGPLTLLTVFQMKIL